MSSLGLTSIFALCNSWRLCPVGPGNCAMQFVGCMSLLTEIAHCIVSVLSRLGWTAHCIIPAISQALDIPDSALHSFGIQSPNLPTEIAQPSWLVTLACCKLVLKFVLVFNWEIAFHECFHVSRYCKCSSASQKHKYNGLQESRVKGHRWEHNVGCSQESVYDIAYLRRHQVVRKQGHQDKMATSSQWETPSIAVEGSTPSCNECKRKGFDNTEVKQSCKLK